MKVMVQYSEQYYLVNTNSSEDYYDMDDLFSQVNSDRWPDECQLREWLEESARIICFMNDEAEIIRQ